ncbi:MAG: hypothetical protein AMXMBFR66_36440 [Pseudomonadota bacterium]|nr:ShlB/FhaC/HecB family hemolysin secretion/activation protein [Rubrivivax sp.]
MIDAKWSSLRAALLCATNAALVALAAPAAALAQTVPAVVDVERVVVEGATLIAPQALLAGVPLPRGPTPIASLQHLAERVQSRYAEAGYGGVVAYLPPQPVTGGIVRIVVVEGKLTAIAVRGAEGAAADAARAALPDLTIGGTPLLRRLDRELQLANENPARQLQLLLAPGDRTGDIAAELTVRQRDPLQFVLSADNTGNEQTGRWRLGAAVQHADVSGVGDVASLLLQTSPDHASSVAVASAAYRRPLPGALTMLEAYAAYSDVDAGSSATAAGDLRLSGRGLLTGLRATRFLPLGGALDQRVALALDRRAYRNRCEIAGLPAAACGGAAGDVTVMPLTLEYSLRSPQAFGWAVTALWSHNLGAGGQGADAASFEAARAGAKRAFDVLHGAVSAQDVLGEDWRLHARASLQWTADALVSGEQFGLGGVASVRGYRERELAGDRGVAATVEIAAPELLPRPGKASLRLFGFADGGVVSNRLGAPCRLDQTRCTLAGVGLGLAFEGAGMHLRLAVARALRDGAQTARGDMRVHAAAQYAF